MTGHGLRRRGPVAALLAGSGVALVVIAIVVTHGGHAPAAVPVVDRGVVPPPTIRQSQRSTHAAGVGHGLARAARLVIGRLHTNAPVVDVGVARGVMTIPRDPGVVGWWTGGAAPGDGSGHVVLVGHVNYAGKAGALAVLPQLRPGDTVGVGSPDHQVRYRVIALRSYAKTSGLPASIFTRTGAEQLVLITCGGSFDPASGNYDDNIVAYASPIPG